MPQVNTQALDDNDYEMSYQLSDWDNTDFYESNDPSKLGRKASKKNWKEQRRESRNFKRGEWE